MKKKSKASGEKRWNALDTFVVALTVISVCAIIFAHIYKTDIEPANDDKYYEIELLYNDHSNHFGSTEAFENKSICVKGKNSPIGIITNIESASSDTDNADTDGFILITVRCKRAEFENGVITFWGNTELREDKTYTFATVDFEFDALIQGIVKVDKKDITDNTDTEDSLQTDVTTSTEENAETTATSDETANGK